MITVSIGIIVNSKQQILVEQRQHYISYGGYWAFPGCKVEPGESIFDALVRELREEIAINVQKAEPFFAIEYHYPDKSVDLQAWRITEYSGDATSCEGQLIRWVAIKELAELDFLPPNKKIVQAVLEYFR
jgi:8-oxo-dGTP diphosphatase